MLPTAVRSTKKTCVPTVSTLIALVWLAFKFTDASVGAVLEVAAGAGEGVGLACWPEPDLERTVMNAMAVTAATTIPALMSNRIFFFMAVQNRSGFVFVGWREPDRIQPRADPGALLAVGKPA